MARGASALAFEADDHRVAGFNDAAFNGLVAGVALAQPLEQAFSDATRTTGIVAAAFILVGLASSFLLPRVRERS